MQTNTQGINNLRKIIYSQLDPHIKGNYCLLDVPDHPNIGDSLIYAGELAYLERLSYKCTYTANVSRCQLNRIEKDSIILLHGGGNFGDLWRQHQEFRNKIIEKYKNNKIIVFPQTVHYKNEEILKADAMIHNDHPNLILCARDKKAYDILKSNFTNNTILLVPDMAFCIDIPKRYTNTPASNKVLILKRTDKEINENIDLSKFVDINKNITVEVKDWPTYDLSFFKSKVENITIKIDSMASRLLINIPFIGKTIDHRYGIKGSKLYETYITNGMEFVKGYDEIYSTRLHVFILAVLMGKKVHMLDNSYGKNSNFYKAWMSGFKNISLVEELEVAA